ncbi:GTP binding protein [Aureococcus anophagefferens]|nr:GTP binding protein [Aureococcus anophagefferens]
MENDRQVAAADLAFAETLARAAPLSVSAEHGDGLPDVLDALRAFAAAAPSTEEDELLPSLDDEARRRVAKRVSTGALNTWFRDFRRGPRGEAFAAVRYLAQVGHAPPTFALFGRNLDAKLKPKIRRRSRRPSAPTSASAARVALILRGGGAGALGAKARKRAGGTRPGGAGQRRRAARRGGVLNRGSPGRRSPPPRLRTLSSPGADRRLRALLSSPMSRENGFDWPLHPL